MPTKPLADLSDGAASAPAVSDASQTIAPALAEPAAGGNYVRCLTTGALLPNPEFATASTPTEE